MKCDRCENEATVHEWTKVGGEKHLCEQCASKAGLPVQSQTQITQLIAQNIASLLKPASEPASESPAAPGADATPAVTVCPSCGTALSQFRNSGLLGCPDCYAAFEGQLAPLIQRAHEGATHHTGKTPRSRSGGPGAPQVDVRAARALAAERVKKLDVLKKQIGEAVAAEHYERAAKLRDEVRRIETELASPDAGDMTT